MPDTPWAEYRKPSDRPISSRGAAFLLKDFDIESKKVRSAARYWRKDFEEAWASYLPPEVPVPPN